MILNVFRKQLFESILYEMLNVDKLKKKKTCTTNNLAVNEQFLLDLKFVYTKLTKFTDIINVSKNSLLQCFT